MTMAKKVHDSQSAGAGPMIGRADDGQDRKRRIDGMVERFQASESTKPTTIDDKTRSVEVVGATETPAEVWDPCRFEVCEEILLMSGCQIPADNSIPLTVEHIRSAEAVIGSYRDMKVEGDQLVGRVFFSEAPDAEPYWIKVKERHLKKFSITYPAAERESVFIAEGQTTVVAGKAYTGPLLVTTKWTPKALGLVIFAADDRAQARSEHHANTQKEVSTMDPKLRKFLERCGLPATATDAEAQAFLDRAEPLKPAAQQDPPQDLDQIRSEAVGAERTRINEIDALLERYECQDMARELIVGKDGVVPTLADAQRAVLAKLHDKAKNPGFSGIQLVADEKDKFRAAANDALMLRAGMAVATPAPGAQDLCGYTLVEMARECLRVVGLSYRGGAKEMVGRALTSSDFPNILANLATKSMQQAWDQAKETWSVWCGIGSVSDFKTYYDNALSEHDDLEEVPNSGEIKFGGFTEKTPETYKAASYAKKFRITRVMIINDDMSALTEMPAKRAEAAARKVGDVAYAVITANGNMGDSRPIFSAVYHSNDAISGYLSAPGVTNIAEGIRAMGVQKDIAGKRRLNIQPVFFLAPKALEGTSEIFFRSGNFSDSNTVATDSAFASTRANPYAGNYFTRVYEPRLDDDSTTAYYLMGPKGKTVKVVFLNGVQAPTMEMRQPGFTIEGFEYLVSIDVGAYATDYRAMYRNEGA
jgi:hypothetical protein